MANCLDVRNSVSLGPLQRSKFDALLALRDDLELDRHLAEVGLYELSATPQLLLRNYKIACRAVDVVQWRIDLALRPRG